MNKKKLNSVRNKIDRLDYKLLNIIKSRTYLVKKIIKIKKYKNQIVDQKRIRKVLANVRKLSIKKNIDPKITHKIWISMIRSFIDYEKRNFNKK